jgi:hypothetical protein
MNYIVEELVTFLVPVGSKPDVCTLHKSTALIEELDPRSAHA